MAETEENESEQTPQGDAAGGEQSGAAQAAAVESGTGGSPRRRSRGRKAEKPAGQPLSPEERHARRVAQRAGNAAHRRRRRLQEREKALAARSGAAAAPELPAVHAPKRGAPKERQGIVVSSKADKTITVRIDVARQHRRYEKTVRSSTTLHAHDEQNSANEGDVVRVVESRPSSKTKRWQLVDVMERAR